MTSSEAEQLGGPPNGVRYDNDGTVDKKIDNYNTNLSNLIVTLVLLRVTHVHHVNWLNCFTS